jgi:SAM-dependent methyltransferase
MNWRRYVPRFAKRMLRSTRNTAQAVIAPPQKSRNELHQYWTEPYDGSNSPEDYLTLANPRRSEYLVQVAQSVATPQSSVLEIGCNVGRNLNYLFEAGFHKLTGIEISDNAVRLLKASYPEMAQNSALHCCPIEDIIKTFSDRQFDFVFTMAVLEHIHFESEWIFGEIARIAGKHLFIYEDEGCQSWRHFPRNYQKIFEKLGWKQVREETGLDLIGIGGSFVARLFVREQS